MEVFLDVEHCLGARMCHVDASSWNPTIEMSVVSICINLTLTNAWQYYSRLNVEECY